MEYSVGWRNFAEKIELAKLAAACALQNFQLLVLLFPTKTLKIKLNSSQHRVNNPSNHVELRNLLLLV
jgi:hypothetical protein